MAKKSGDGYKRKVDRRMRYYGECDFENKTIKVNPKKGDLLNTIIHEELHRKHPEKSEKWVKDKSKKIERGLTVNKAAKLLGKYIKK